MEARIFTADEQELISRLHNGLIERKLTISSAESCTSGLAAFALTHQPGSSAYYMGGVNCYSNKAKIELLGVDPSLIEKYGAVSKEVAESLAKGSRSVFETDISISFTGIAGPEGGTRDKPVGTVWTAISFGSQTKGELLQLDGDRHAIRQTAVSETLKRVLNLVEVK